MRDRTKSKPLVLLTAVDPRKREGGSPTGLVGRHLARQLLAQGVPVRVLAEPGQLDGWAPEVEVVRGSITSPSDAKAAFDSVAKVFLAGAEPGSVTAVVTEACAAGVERIVVLSSHGCEFEPMFPPGTWFWLAIEKAVERSGIPWTHIRPSAVMGACIEGTYPATGSDWATSIRCAAAVREALLDRGYYPFIHEADLAAAAAAALLRQGLTGQVLEAVGLPISTRSRIAAIAKAVGRPIPTETLTADQGRAVWRKQGWPEGAIEVTLFALETYASQLKELTDWTLAQSPSVAELIGRPLLGFEEWARENAGFYIAGAPSPA